MTDVFISYKQEEREAVQIIASALNDLKLSVWFDTKLRAGGSFDEEIAAALDAAKSVLVCWTPAAVQSEWVRGEATQAMQSNRLVACFLQPSSLIPPFNLTHAENLSAWAGQSDDPAWIKLLERIGELTGRPGLATYAAAMQPGAPIQRLKDWGAANGADPLADNVWARLKLLEGEGANERIEREKTEARAAGERRKALEEKSRRLARERGLRDPRAERRRFMLLVGSVVAVAVLSLGAIVYFVDTQGRDRRLRDEANSVAAVREFIADNAWHPISGRAREKLARLDADAWNRASAAGTIEALEAYLEGARPAPQGAFVGQAETQLVAAQETKRVQEVLSRLLIYRGSADGAMNNATRLAIRTFRYRWNLQVSDEIDDVFRSRLASALEIWIHPRLEDLQAVTRDRPSEADFIRLAAAYEVEGAVIEAIARVEAGRFGAFDSAGRITVLLEPHHFSRRTNGRFDQSHPNLSRRNWNPQAYPRGESNRWIQFEQAFSLDADAAIQATSYGRAGVMGFNYRSFGFETPGEFARFISQSEANQYEAIMLFARSNGLIDELQRHDWAGFARRYNGPGYQTVQYDRRLAAAYESVTAEVAVRYGSLLPGQDTRPPPVAERVAQPAVAAEPADDGIDLPDTGGADRSAAFAALLIALLAGLGGAALLYRRRA